MREACCRHPANCSKQLSGTTLWGSSAPPCDSRRNHRLAAWPTGVDLPWSCGQRSSQPAQAHSAHWPVVIVSGGAGMHSATHSTPEDPAVEAAARERLWATLSAICGSSSSAINGLAAATSSLAPRAQSLAVRMQGLRRFSPQNACVRLPEDCASDSATGAFEFAL